jgi:hypothetical protein
MAPRLAPSTKAKLAGGVVVVTHGWYSTCLHGQGVPETFAKDIWRPEGRKHRTGECHFG